MVIPPGPQEEEALLSLLDQHGAVTPPGEVLRDVDPRNFKLVT